MSLANYKGILRGGDIDPVIPNLGASLPSRKGHAVLSLNSVQAECHGRLGSFGQRKIILLLTEFKSYSPDALFLLLQCSQCWQRDI
jgi:hypothetical protein